MSHLVGITKDRFSHNEGYILQGIPDMPPEPAAPAQTAPNPATATQPAPAVPTATQPAPATALAPATGGQATGTPAEPAPTPAVPMGTDAPPPAGGKCNNCLT